MCNPLDWSLTPVVQSCPKNQNSTACVQILLDGEHVEVSARDAEGMTPAMYACHLDRLEHLQLLRRASAAGDELLFDTDRRGRCALHYAIRRAESLRCLTVRLRLRLRSHSIQFGSAPLHSHHSRFCSLLSALEWRLFCALFTRRHSLRERSSATPSTQAQYGDSYGCVQAMLDELQETRAERVRQLCDSSSKTLFLCAAERGTHCATRVA